MSFRKIENDIKSGALNRPAPVLLFGEEGFLVDHYEKKLTALFSGAEPGGDGSTDTSDAKTHGGDNSTDAGERGATTSLNDLDISVFHGDEAGDDAIMAALDTFPMLLPARTVIVRSHPGLSSQGAATSDGGGKKPKNSLADYVKQMPQSSRLILSSGSVNKTRALYKAVSKHGSVYEFSRLDETDLHNFVRTRFKRIGAEITPGVLDAFIFATGYLEKDSDKDLFTIENDVYKLASFVIADGRKAIDHPDIEECLEGVLRTDVFAMLDAISTGRKAEAINLLENSLADGESGFRLLSLFTGHFEIMLGYRELSAIGHSTKEITQILGERSDWRVKKLGGFAGRFETSKLRDILRRLYEVEKQIKTGNLPERLALTVLLAEI